MASNGTSFGHMNGSSANSENTQWKLGFLNSQGKYLTAEAFGFKVNASATTFRKKQVWTLEYGSGSDGDVVYIKSYQGKYLAADKNGNVRCDLDEKDDADAKFMLQYESKSGGRGWSFKSMKYDCYLSGNDDALYCKSKTPDYWMPRLASHPQVNLRNVNRKRYAHFARDTDEIQCSRVIPWGDDSLITLEFKDGGYALRACDDRYLHMSGKLVSVPSDDTYFTLELKPSAGVYGSFALKDRSGMYLSAASGMGGLKGRKKTITKDELFTIEDSHPQVTITAHNNKRVSIKQGVDVTANQLEEEVSDTETFQMEFDKASNKWRFRCSDGNYWTLAEASGIQAIADKRNENSLFEFEWFDDGAISLKASNGSYVTAKMNGHLYAVSPAPTDKERFFISLVNRPLLVLKCDYGYVGFKAPGQPRLECNRSVHDILHLKHIDAGKYSLAGVDGKYLTVSEDGSINADGTEPLPFIFEFHQLSKFSIKAPNGCYIRGEQNGIFNACGKQIANNTLWEF
ncbi:protein singed-like [Tubulanus polymorphus]|uniref:protein singed-like n=1 Tax=Tubulanus polymorphus TaxID=672921 RepID=UPI003DA1F8F7